MRNLCRTLVGVLLSLLLGCGDGGPTGPSKPTGIPVTQEYSVQDNTGRELARVSYSANEGDVIRISGADISPKVGATFDTAYMVVRHMPVGSQLGAFITKTTTGLIQDQATKTPKALYVVDTSTGFTPWGVLDRSHGFGEALPYGRNPTISLMSTGERFPKPDSESYVVAGGSAELEEAVRIHNRFAVTDSGVVLARVSIIPSGGDIRAAIVDTLGYATGWHTNTGQIGVVAFVAFSGRVRVLADELVEEMQRADNMYGISTGATLFPQRSESLELTSKGKAALQYTLLFARP